MPVAVSKITPHIGATVTGASGPALVDPAVAEVALAALDDSGVVVFPSANVTDDDFVGFSRLLGEVQLLPRGTLKSHPEISPVTRDASKSTLADYREATFLWHMDGTSDDTPNKVTLLTARQIAEGDAGDTEFANTYAAYEALPEAEKAALEPLRVVHSFAYSQRRMKPDAPAEEQAQWERIPPREHPIVWHRRDGRTSLVIGTTAGAIVGLDAEESAALIDHLNEWATQPQFTLRHRWHQGDLVMFDNTGLLHRALPYAASSPRLMHRITTAGQESFA